MNGTKDEEQRTKNKGRRTKDEEQRTKNKRTKNEEQRTKNKERRTMDKLTPQQRHKCMAAIRSRDTKPELKVRRWLWSHGYRYRLNVKSVPGKPDIVMRRYRTAIFVNGCFWHGHNVALPQVKSEKQKVKNEEVENSKCCKIPQTNREFWVSKIERNKRRDQRNYEVLQENGWHIIVVWECQLTAKRIENTMRGVERRLNENFLSIYSQHKPVLYSQEEEDTSLPMAAENIVEYKPNNDKELCHE